MHNTAQPAPTWMLFEAATHKVACTGVHELPDDISVWIMHMHACVR